MSKTTDNLGLFEYDPSTDGAQTFNIEKSLNENWDKIDAAVLLALAAAAPYSSEQTYALGAYCTRGGRLYRCTTAITAAEVWTDGHWTETTVGTELVAIYAALAVKSDAGHIHDDRYYTEAEVNILMAGKQDASSAINTGNIGSQSVNYANSAGSAPANGGTSATLGQGGDPSIPMTFNWQGPGGQPAWLWGGDDGRNMFVYSPAALSVNYANGAGNADTVDGWHMNLDPGSWGIKPICAGTGDMVAGSTALADGHIYLVYE